MTSPAADPGGVGATRDQVYAALSAVRDPELPMSVVDLGLIYDVRVSGTSVDIDMTFTSTGCPVHDLMTDDVHDAAAALDGVSSVRVNIVWDPPWTSGRIAPRGRSLLSAWGISS
jgi:metal-sulfur cluster biosynthetic enzyme